MLSRILCFGLLTLSLQSVALATEDYDATLLKAGNTKIAECTSKTGHNITLSVYADVSVPFTSWEESPGVIYFVFNTTEPTVNGESSLLMEAKYDMTYGGGLFAADDANNIQTVPSLPLTFVDIAPPDSEWLAKLDLWHDADSGGFAQFTCQPLWQP